MIGEYKLAPVPGEDVDPYQLMRELQQSVARYYRVHPIDSNRAYEELIDDAGIYHRIRHRSFVYRFDGKADAKKVSQACEQILKDIQATFPEGATIMWRLRPTVEERDISEICEACGQVMARPAFATFVRCRLGCVGTELSEDHFSHEGFLVKKLEA